MGVQSRFECNLGPPWLAVAVAVDDFAVPGRVSHVVAQVGQRAFAVVVSDFESGDLAVWWTN